MFVNAPMTQEKILMWGNVFKKKKRRKDFICFYFVQNTIKYFPKHFKTLCKSHFILSSLNINPWSPGMQFKRFLFLNSLFHIGIFSCVLKEIQFHIHMTTRFGTIICRLHKELFLAGIGPATRCPATVKIVQFIQLCCIPEECL
ncbi:hypothetical protein SFRURICE_010063 [Spodoptera frugiperda]|nr:hypothetical protein SFRURICE_010063 [Spodoptera frugiperda]